ncbi:MAG: hypothetical protein ACRDKZ_15430 [Actinomycetota bacterium]
MQGTRLIAAAGALSLVLSVPALADQGPRSRPEPLTMGAPAVSLTPYRGLAAWVDMYDGKPWEAPSATVKDMAARGTKTLFVETGNYKKRTDIYKRRSLGRMLDTAHEKGMQVVAWYVPSFTNNVRDFRRIKKAINFTSPGGERFDSFAMDIEATVATSITARNRRMLALSDRVRKLVGPAYALGAITPDPVTQRYWPGFPYQGVAARYDAFLPMAYWTYRTRGESRVYRYVSDAIAYIRRAAGHGDPIHIIGGIASDASTREVRGFARAARAHNAIGASLYDYPITSARQWKQMRRLNVVD